MPSVNDVCESLAVAVATVPGLRAVGYIDDQVNPPQAQVFTREFDPRMTMGGSASRPVMLGVRIFVKRTDVRTAQRQLRNYMEQSGSSSVRAAIENSDNWNATVHYAEVTGIGQPFEYETAAEVYWAVDFDVDVIW
jgi:hypothetical protein